MSPSDEIITDRLFITRKNLLYQLSEWYNSKGFRRWYISFGITDCLNFVHRPVFKTKLNTTFCYPRG
jgi:hypothetical protein